MFVIEKIRAFVKRIKHVIANMQKVKGSRGE